MNLKLVLAFLLTAKIGEGDPHRPERNIPRTSAEEIAAIVAKYGREQENEILNRFGFADIKTQNADFGRAVGGMILVQSLLDELRADIVLSQRKIATSYSDVRSAGLDHQNISTFWKENEPQNTNELVLKIQDYGRSWQAIDKNVLLLTHDLDAFGRNRIRIDDWKRIRSRFPFFDRWNSDVQAEADSFEKEFGWVSGAEAKPTSVQEILRFIVKKYNESATIFKKSSDAYEAISAYAAKNVSIANTFEGQVFYAADIEGTLSGIVSEINELSAVDGMASSIGDLTVSNPYGSAIPAVKGYRYLGREENRKINEELEQIGQRRADIGKGALDYANNSSKFIEAILRVADAKISEALQSDSFSIDLKATAALSSQLKNHILILDSILKSKLLSETDQQLVKERRERLNTWLEVLDQRIRQQLVAPESAFQQKLDQRIGTYRSSVDVNITSAAIQERVAEDYIEIREALRDAIYANRLPDANLEFQRLQNLIKLLRAAPDSALKPKTINLRREAVQFESDIESLLKVTTRGACGVARDQSEFVQKIEAKLEGTSR